MPGNLVTALFLFCLATTITPGPNNMMLLSSGATFGLRRTVPHIIGISLGCALMVLVLGGCVTAFSQYLPAFLPVLHIISAAYLMFLAWRIATAGGLHERRAAGRPFGMFHAAAFQWVNPKAWVMVLGAVTSFARPVHMTFDVLIIALVMIVVGLPCITLWAGTGSMLKRFLQHPLAFRTFNYSMAALLVVSVLPGLWEQVRSFAGSP